MYIGSTDTRGLMHCLWEIIDNAVDEALGGFGREIKVTLLPGRQHRRSPTRAGASPSTSSRAPGCRVSRWSSPSCTPAASSAPAPTTPPAVCTASVPRWSTRCRPGWTSRSTAIGATWAMSFRRGAPGIFDGDGPTAPFTAGGSLRKVGRTPKGITGTRVRYWPDRQIFLQGCAAVAEGPARPRPADQLPGAGLALHVVDARTAEVTTERFQHEGGIAEFCEFLAPDAAVTEVAPAAGSGPVHRDGADARRRRPHDADRRRARPRHRHRGALGRRVRHHHRSRT